MAHAVRLTKQMVRRHLRLNPPSRLQLGDPWARTKVWERDNGWCVYCGAAGQVVDHVIPSRLQGPNSTANLVVACLPCDIKKRGQIPMIMLETALTYLVKAGEPMEWIYVYGYSLLELRPAHHQEAFLANILYACLPDGTLA